jgi:uncharacterized protein
VTLPPPLSRRAPWDWHDILLILVVAVLVGGVGSVLASGLVRSLDGALSAQDRASVEALAAQLVFYGVAIAVTLLVITGRRHVAVAELGWRRPSLNWVLAAVPLAIVGLGVAAILTGIAESLLHGPQNQQCIAVRQQYGHSVLLALPVVCVAAPIVEETVFRGVIYRWLRGVLPLNVAMLASGAIFAAAHAITLLFLPLLGFGVLLAWIYERSRSLWPGVLVHALFNLVGIIEILTAPRC